MLKLSLNSFETFCKQCKNFEIIYNIDNQVNPDCFKNTFSISNVNIYFSQIVINTDLEKILFKDNSKNRIQVNNVKTIYISPTVVGQKIRIYCEHPVTKTKSSHVFIMRDSNITK